MKPGNTHAALYAGIYWGAIWGLYEATVGWLVHFLPRLPGTASMVMIPFAVFCMDQALRSGGGRTADAMRGVLAAAGTAAMIKLVDIFLPARSLQSVINPAVSILLQGIAFAAVAHALGLARRVPALKTAALGVLAFSAGWRLLFLLYSAVLAWGWSLGMLRDGIHTPMGFMVRDSISSAAVVLVVMGLVYRRRQALPAAPRPIIRRMTITAVLVLAIGFELLLAS